MRDFKKIVKRQFHLPGEKKILRVIRSFTPTQSAVFWILVFIFIVAVGILVWKANDELLEEVPVKGGSFKEGLIGAPRFINPLLDQSSSDKDLTTLVYAGLTRKDANGDIVPELAERFQVSEDGRIYTFTLAETAVFHDNTPVTSADVVFTIDMIKNQQVQSPKRTVWNDVTATAIDEKTVTLELRENFAPFLGNTTIGILPKHLWEQIPPDQAPFSDLNINPIGAGPYKVNGVTRNSSGIATAYNLQSFENYVLGQPFVEEIDFVVFSTEDERLEAYNNHSIGAIANIPYLEAQNIRDSGRRLEMLPLSRIFSVFLNHNKLTLFNRSEVREALSLAIDKNRLVDEVLGGFATPLSSPILPGLESAPQKNNLMPEEERLPYSEVLAEDGWEFVDNAWTLETNDDIKELSFTLTVPNVPELVAVARNLQTQWEEAGIRVNISAKESEALTQEVIRPRDYEALLFGQIVARPVDLFAFWHSSQRSDPGLNVALYTNSEADRILQALRETSDQEEIVELLEELEEEIKTDNPAVFLYSPSFAYALPEKIKGVNIGTISTSEDRFSEVHEWFIEVNREWFFLN